MTIIHMKTEDILALISHLGSTLNLLETQSDSLDRSCSRLDASWHSPTGDHYHQDLKRWTRKLKDHLDRLEHLQLRLNREVEEWTLVDRSYEGSNHKIRVYLVNGINYNGDDSSFELMKQNMEDKYGADVEVVIISDHPYTSDMPTNLGQVAEEYFSGQGGQSDKVYHAIEADLKRNALLGHDDIEVVLVGHSGGGAIVSNIAGRVEEDLGVEVRGVVTMGSPLANLDKAHRETETTVIDISNPYDGPSKLYGIGELRSDEARIIAPLIITAFGINNPLVPAAIVTADRIFQDNDPNIIHEMIAPDKSFNLKGYAKDEHSSYWPSNQVVDIIGERLSF